jgi:integron integrase
MQNETFHKPSKAEQDMKWAQVWFSQMANFHRKRSGGQSDLKSWDFTQEEVIAFLQSKRDAGMPAWKRGKVLHGLLVYRRMVQEKPIDKFSWIGDKLLKIAQRERANREGYDTIEEAIGVIDTREIDAVQELRRAMRRQGLAKDSEKAYVGKLKAFMSDRGLTCLADFDGIGSRDVEAHLTDLAVDGNVSPSAQNVAFNALKKFFTAVLKRDMGEINAIRASKGKMVPTVMSSREVRDVLAHLEGVQLVVAKLLYGCGLRISEAVRLRVKDIDFDNRLIEIHKSKGDKSRLVPLPEDLMEPLRRFMASRETLHAHDLADGCASVWLPHALSRKWPSAHREFRWQYLFASSRLSRDPRTRRIHRHHVRADTFSRHLRRAVESVGITKHVTSHTFRHCFATHLLWSGTDIRTIQELLGHSDVKTTMIYTHVLNRRDIQVVSPLDRLEEACVAVA